MSTPPAEPGSPPASAHASSELAAEREHLKRARADLAAMRERTLGLKVQGGDHVSDAYLAATLHRRAQSLHDDPSAALFFGRLDLIEPMNGQDRWYIGRRHVADAQGNPDVIDWRATVSTAFYRASPADPMGVRRRRRFGLDRGEITGFEDEPLTEARPGSGLLHSQILADEIERPRVGPMRDIVATIQPEQDVVVRLDLAQSICVQGAPGTGKTAVGLHRAAWLLYAFREALSRNGVLVIGPNRAFLEHVGAVLPSLGEVDVAHATVEELVAGRVPITGADTAQVATLKGDPRMAELIHRAVWSQVNTDPQDPLVLKRGIRTWRVPAYEVREILQELIARGVRYHAAQAMLPQRLAHAILVQMEAAGESPDDRVQDAVSRTTTVKAYAKALWPMVKPDVLLHLLFSDPTTLETHASELFSAEEQQLLLWDKPPRTPGRVRWSVADATALDELADQLTRTPSLGHVVLDEAQDLSPMQLRAVGRRCSTGSVTVLGDLAQGTTPWATGSWAQTMHHLGQDGAHLEELTRGFRVPAAVIEYAARLLPFIAPELAQPVSVRSNRGDLRVVQDQDMERALLQAVRDASVLPGSVGVIVPDDDAAAISELLDHAGLAHGRLDLDHGDIDHQVDVVPAMVAKGLEFDRVVVSEPGAIAAAEPDERTGLRRLYVVLTRAVSGLTVVHRDPLPAALADPTTHAEDAVSQQECRDQ